MNLPTIPEFKKEEDRRERKRSGLLWWGSPGSNVPFWARVFPWIARAFPGLAESGIFGFLMNTAMLTALIAAGVGGYKALNQAPAASGGGVGGLAMESDGLTIKRPKQDTSLDFLSHANQGELRFDEARPPMKDAPASAPAAVAEQSKPTMPSPDELMAQAGKKGLDASRDGFVHKLTSNPSDLMGGKGSAFASNDIFGGGAKGLSGKIGNGSPKFDSSRGQLSAKFRGMSAMRPGSSLSLSRMKSSNALGQLRRSTSQSGIGAQRVTGQNETGSQYAANAFDQQKADPGSMQMPAGVNGGQPVVVPPGNGAPDVSNMPGAPSQPFGQNLTGYQGLLDQAKGLTGAASQMKLMGDVLLAIGALLILIGGAMVWPPANLWGLALIALGGMLVASGAMMLSQASDMSNKANEIGDRIKNNYGQTDQGNIVNTCAQQAAQNGTSAANCNGGASSQDANQQLQNNRNSTTDAVNNEVNASSH